MAQNLQRSGEGQFVIERGTASGEALAALMAKHGVPPQPAKMLTRAAKESTKEALASCR